MSVVVSQKQVRFDNATTVYWDAGEHGSRPILLLHGGLGDAYLSWHRVWDELGRAYHVIAPDLPGFDGSDALPEDALGSLVLWLRGFYDALALKEAVLVGSSYGGLVARMFAAAYPAYVPALVLVNAGMFPRSLRWTQWVNRSVWLASLVSDLLSRRACTKSGWQRVLVVRDAVTAELLAHVYANRAGYAGLMRALLAADASHMGVPPVATMLLWGESDPLAPEMDAKQLQEDIPASHLIMISDCGHMPQLETPDVFIFQLQDFLDHLTRRTRPIMRGAGQLPSLDI